MPFQSGKQLRFMYSQHPDIAKRWTSEFPANASAMAKQGANKKISPARRSKTQAERTVDAMRRVK